MSDISRPRLMRTHTGRMVDPTALRPEDVSVYDIAHALSNLCRFSGQCKRFHSVGEHSVLVAQIAFEAAGPAAARMGLMHDPHEAYGGDMITPVKRRFPDFEAMQTRNQAAIEQAFGIADTPASIRELVKQIDGEIVHDEMRDLFDPPPEWLAGRARTYPDLRFGLMSPVGAEVEFLLMFSRLWPVTP